MPDFLEGPYTVDSVLDDEMTEIILDRSMPEFGCPILLASVDIDNDGRGPVTPKMARGMARLFASSPEMHNLLTGKYWLVWSNEHKAWWGPNKCGCYWKIEAAGRYTLEEAMKISETRLVKRGDEINPPELIQPSPEWLELRYKVLAKVDGKRS